MGKLRLVIKSVKKRSVKASVKTTKVPSKNKVSKLKFSSKTKPITTAKTHKVTYTKTHTTKSSRSIFERVFKTSHEMPLGIRVFVVYLLLLTTFNLVLGLSYNKAMVFGLIFEGSAALVINFITVVLIVLLLIGFAKKKIKYYYASLIFFVLIILNTLISIFALRAETYGVLRNFVNIAFTLTLILNIITILFLLSKKYYFLHPKPEYHVHSTDKLFMMSLVVIWAILIISTIATGNQYYKETFSQVDQLIFDLDQRGVVESFYYCGINNAVDTDLCFYIAAMLNTDDPNAGKLCEEIRMPIFYKDCVETIGQ